MKHHLLRPITGADQQREGPRNPVATTMANAHNAAAKKRGLDSVDKDIKREHDEPMLRRALGGEDVPDISADHAAKLDAEGKARKRKISKAYDDEHVKHVIFRDPGTWLHLHKGTSSKHTASVMMTQEDEDARETRRADAGFGGHSFTPSPDSEYRQKYKASKN